jgi:uncharacterized tellurite resistance protein B-like protein
MSIFERFRLGICRSEDPAGAAERDPVRLATAAILLDIGYADSTLSPSEDEGLLAYLKEKFSLTDEHARELVMAADQIRSRQIDHYSLTSLIRKSASLAERIEIVKTMWRMVYSDGKLTENENHMVRKLADLLGIEHHVMIDAKVSVLREIGQTTA